jgi:hypothetical protein
MCLRRRAIDGRKLKYQITLNLFRHIAWLLEFFAYHWITFNDGSVGLWHE